ncbi:hypothetical protein KDD17_17530 [Sulfitobacter albidus]|uniref:Uncharacterized protein n=1 Tax=Sulfitobacter albidus TaxID=2829501 RepID=A0A975JGQ1_9RHOB|nr:hypothetical protein [Sulfitobacter albidus]QUJ78143.1 hypothetical protein KDD17_17530 [Sulfitobacter albidus]
MLKVLPTRLPLRVEAPTVRSLGHALSTVLILMMMGLIALVILYLISCVPDLLRTYSHDGARLGVSFFPHT